MGTQFAGNCADQTSTGLQAPVMAHPSGTVPIPDAVVLEKWPKKIDLLWPVNARRFDGDQDQAVLSLDEVKVYGTIEPEDIKKPDKSQIAKLRDFLDKTGKSYIPTFTESVGADGSRVVRISTSGRTYWIDKSRGQVGWLDVNTKKIATNCWAVVDNISAHRHWPLVCVCDKRCVRIKLKRVSHDNESIISYLPTAKTPTRASVRSC